MNKKSSSTLDYIFACTALIFFMGVLAGFAGRLGGNIMCFRLLGCNAGFFGYDAVGEHFPTGIFVAVGVVWVSKKFPRRSILLETTSKNILIILAIVALFCISWEMLEFIHDNGISKFAPFNEIPFLLPHSVAQPSNADTMGDITADMLGGVVGILILKAAKQGVL